MSGYLEGYLNGLSSEISLLFFTPQGDESTTIGDLTAQLHSQLSSAESSGRPVLVLGHSFGSVLLFETLRQYGAAGVAGLVLMSWIHDSDFAGFWFRDDPQRETKACQAMMQMNVMSTTVGFQARDTIIALVELFFAKGHHEEGVQMLKAAAWSGALSNPRGPVSQHLSREFCFREDLEGLGVPCLSLVGSEDQRLPPSYFAGITEALPAGSTHVCVQGAGHFPFVERPEEVQQQIREFVGRLLSADAADTDCTQKHTG